jgi:hypothetical protein
LAAPSKEVVRQMRLLLRLGQAVGVEVGIFVFVAALVTVFVLARKKRQGERPSTAAESGFPEDPDSSGNEFSVSVLGSLG